MLRAVEDLRDGSENVRVSSGSAAVLGLAALRVEVPPTTAYLMVGERCSMDCAFCAQARSSTARADQLSRVVWPRYPLSEVVPRIAAAFASGAIARCCLQVVAAPDHAERTRAVVRAMRQGSAVPLCVCTRASGLEDVRELLALGVERVTLALDAASEPVYNRVKGRHWARFSGLLQEAARAYPGRLGTHLIIGLGETEAEAAAFLQEMHDLGVLTALFAFTPVPGTALEGEQPPSEVSYRRCQVARYLIVNGLARADRFRYSPKGEIASYGVPAGVLEEVLRTGEAYRTSGCSGCNRPFYNERPGGPLYNYPRPLSPTEAEAATALVMASLTH